MANRVALRKSAVSLARVNCFEIIYCAFENRTFQKAPSICALSASGGKGECDVFYKGEPLKITSQRKNRMQSRRRSANIGFFLKITEFLRSLFAKIRELKIITCAFENHTFQKAPSICARAHLPFPVNGNPRQGSGLRPRAGGKGECRVFYNGEHLNKQGVPKKICIAKIFWEEEQQAYISKRRTAAREIYLVATSGRGKTERRAAPFSKRRRTLGFS